MIHPDLGSEKNVVTPQVPAPPPSEVIPRGRNNNFSKLNFAELKRSTHSGCCCCSLWITIHCWTVLHTVGLLSAPVLAFIVDGNLYVAILLHLLLLFGAWIRLHGFHYCTFECFGVYLTLFILQMAFDTFGRIACKWSATKGDYLSKSAQIISLVMSWCFSYWCFSVLWRAFKAAKNHNKRRKRRRNGERKKHRALTVQEKRSVSK